MAARRIVRYALVAGRGMATAPPFAADGRPSRAIPAERTRTPLFAVFSRRSHAIAATGPDRACAGNPGRQSYS